ncbi:hypothetical protein TWF730_005276 [Orbilia blumenaviensis]|uniref:Phosphoglycerate mutase-like protein n=1 Tax=Orbilia blumenaviensis TaxID=1796055 RepID=A0AAV9VHW8_9PEZI
MGRPRLIILIRHAQSEGNQNKAIHQTIPDHRVKLTQFGHEQARAAGHRLKDILLPEDTLQIYTSPYRRTRETTANIVESLGEDWKHKTTVYEEPRIREQDVIGFLQYCSETSKDARHIKKEYGRKEPLTVISSTESLMVSRQQMRMTV